MKKSLMVVSVLLVVLVSLSVVSLAFAQTPTPATPNTPYGRGGMMARGAGMIARGASMMARGGGFGMMGNGNGLLHPYMVAALADELGTTAEDVQARMDAGETMYDILAAEGLTAEEAQTTWTAVRSAAFQAAVADGVLTQAQADWMTQRMQNRGGFGGCRGAFGNVQ